jgi:hypothetical protein
MWIQIEDIQHIEEVILMIHCYQSYDYILIYLPAEAFS